MTKQEYDMRQVFIIISLTVVSALAAFRMPETAVPQTLQQALEQKLVNASIRNNETSTHYYEPVEVELVNLTGKAVSVRIPGGDIFVPADAGQQDLLVTEEQLITLKPLEKRTIPVKAMCTEPNDASGNENSTYTLKPNNNPQLLALAKYLQQQKYFSACAQSAVWSVADKRPIRNIYGADSTEEKNLRLYVSQLTGMPMPTLEEINSYETNYHAEPPKEKVGGFFEFDMAKPRDVQIAMFNRNGVLVRELYNKKQVAPGPHRFNFEFDSSVYTEDEYHFKLIVDNEIKINRKWNLKAIRDEFQKQIEENRN